MQLMINEDRIIQVSDVNIGENIRSLRIKSGYKQTQIVNQLQLSGYDISTFSYNRIEKEHKIQPSLLFYIYVIFLIVM